MVLWERGQGATGAVQLRGGTWSPSEKEWFYGNVDKERLGPYSFVEVRGRLARRSGSTRTWTRSDWGRTASWRYVVA